MKTIALICAYNEGRHIREVVNGTLKQVDRVIVVNDGSSDNTQQEVKKTKAVLINHPVNKGKGAALKTGFDYIKKNKAYDTIVLLDGDGQHHPEDIPQLLKKIQEGSKFVIGRRKKRHSPMPLERRAVNFLTSLITSLFLRQRVKDSQSGFRAMRRDVLEKLRLDTDRYEIETEMLIKGGRLCKIDEVITKTIYGEEVSTIHPVKDTGRLLRLFWKSLWW